MSKENAAMWLANLDANAQRLSGVGTSTADLAAIMQAYAQAAIAEALLELAAKGVAIDIASVGGEPVITGWT